MFCKAKEQFTKRRESERKFYGSSSDDAKPILPNVRDASGGAIRESD